VSARLLRRLLDEETKCDRVKISRSDGYRLLKRTARVHDTITRESNGLVPLSPWSWTCLPFTLTPMGNSSYSCHIHEAKREYSHERRYPVELMMKHE
jgi:hypothetical protein